MPYTAGGCHRQEKPVRIFKCIKIYLCYFNCKVIHTKKDHLVLPKIFLCLSNDNVANDNTRMKQGEAKIRDTKHRGSKKKPLIQELILKSFPCRHEQVWKLTMSTTAQRK